MLPDSIKNEIIKLLRPVDPERVILFGSYAYGSPNQDSDIDLYVVTKEDFIPESYNDNLQVKKRIYLALKEFRKKYASDIIVHTLPVHKKFVELGSSFSKEVLHKGIVLI